MFCATLSFTVGIPRGRFLPFDLGMNTLRVGFAFGISQVLTSFTRPSGVLTTSLSTPGVFLPLLSWVIRLTDSNKFA